jgi:hypothetical protein
LMTDGGRALAVPSFESVDGFQIHQSLESGDVIVDDGEILILDGAANL